MNECAAEANGRRRYLTAETQAWAKKGKRADETGYTPGVQDWHLALVASARMLRRCEVAPLPESRMVVDINVPCRGSETLSDRVHIIKMFHIRLLIHSAHLGTADIRCKSPCRAILMTGLRCGR